jgi:hypothetical protein
VLGGGLIAVILKISPVQELKQSRKEREGEREREREKDRKCSYLSSKGRFTSFTQPLSDPNLSKPKFMNIYKIVTIII